MVDAVREIRDRIIINVKTMLTQLDLEATIAELSHV